VAVVPPRVAHKLRRAVGLPERDGVLVRAVEEDSPADHAGIEPGDLIVAAERRPIEDVESLYQALDAAAEGTLNLTVVRASDERDVEVVFDAAAAEA
jgi:S1-C subfamily serine protease